MTLIYLTTTFGDLDKYHEKFQTQYQSEFKDAKFAHKFVNGCLLKKKKVILFCLASNTCYWRPCKSHIFLWHYKIIR